jgi:hypothetical protein
MNESVAHDKKNLKWQNGGPDANILLHVVCIRNQRPADKEEVKKRERCCKRNELRQGGSIEILEQVEHLRLLSSCEEFWSKKTL